MIAGIYDNSTRALGIRWNGGPGEIGFPSVYGNGQWHVVQELLELAILHACLDELTAHPDSQVGQDGAESRIGRILREVGRINRNRH